MGRRAELLFTARLVFKAEGAYRDERSVFYLWADVEVGTSELTGRSNLGRALIRDPVIFEAGGLSVTRGDHWARAFDVITVDLDQRQLDEIERLRNCGQIVFMFRLGGLLHHRGQILWMQPSNHTLSYEVSGSDWIDVLRQLGYGTSYVSVEVPVPSVAGSTGHVQTAAIALEAAMTASRRGDYDEAVADCRPGFDALQEVDKSNFALKPWDPAASKDERFYWIQRSLRHLTHLPHHPNDPVAGEPATGPRVNWQRADAEAAIALLAALVRWRTEHG